MKEGAEIGGESSMMMTVLFGLRVMERERWQAEIMRWMWGDGFELAVFESITTAVECVKTDYSGVFQNVWAEGCSDERVDP